MITEQPTARPPSPVPARLAAMQRRATLRLRALVETVGSNRVAQAVVVLVALHLGLRGWATSASWFAYDDFAFLARGWTEGHSLRVALEPHGGHVMPGGMYLTWLLGAAAPYDFTLAGLVLLGLQGLADLGLVVLLVRMFGLRAGILPPLALYFWSVFSTPMALWWAAGVNQIPLQIVLFWSLASHVSYLRTGARRHLVATVAWILLGLAFYEKTVMVLGALALVSLSYFAAGNLRHRLHTMWREHRPAVVVLLALGVCYLATYALGAPSFGAPTSDNFLLGSVSANALLDVYATGLIGGPLSWTQAKLGVLADPHPALLMGGLLVVGLVLREIHLSRLHSLRAWCLPAFFVIGDITLVLSGRAAFFGDATALEVRYQSELGAVTAIAFACATMPIIGAVETVRVRRSSRLLDHPRRVGALVMVVATLGVLSSAQYAQAWNDRGTGRAYFGNLLSTVRDAQAPIPLIDSPVPHAIVWRSLHPTNLLHNVLAPYADRVDFRTQAVDHLMMVDRDGRVAPVLIAGVRTNRPGPWEQCGYRLGSEPTRIPLHGPALGGRWWARIGYLGSEPTEATVTAGDATYDLELPAGVHAVYVAGAGEVRSVTLSIANPHAVVCTDDVTAGRPVAAEAAE